MSGSILAILDVSIPVDQHSAHAGSNAWPDHRTRSDAGHLTSEPDGHESYRKQSKGRGNLKDANNDMRSAQGLLNGLDDSSKNPIKPIQN